MRAVGEAQSGTSLLNELGAPVRDELAAVEARLAEIFAESKGTLAELDGRVRDLGGKRLRPLLLLLTARMGGSIPPAAIELAAAIELIHTATLLHDDVLDQADQRRRRTTLHAEFGASTAVLMGDRVFARAFAMVAKLRDAEVVEYVADVVRQICEGEILQTAAARQPDLSQERYREIVFLKTGLLYECAAELGARTSGLAAPQAEAVRTLGRDLGIAFQLVDDCLDLSGSEAEVGKTLGTDLAEGKMTLPMIRFRDALGAPERAAFDRVVRGEDRTGLGAWRLRIVTSGAVDAALGDAADLAQSAVAGLAPLNGSPWREHFQRVAGYVIARRR
jgi:octaprenyl-diphosphate synthase